MTPDLSKPYPTRQERAEARETVVQFWRLIELLIRLADVPPEEWTSGRAQLLPRSVPSGPPEHPLQRLERWLSLYGDEIQILRAVRNGIVHAEKVDDIEIRGAEWVGRIIIASLFNEMPSSIDKDWVRAKIERVWQEVGSS